MAGKNGTEPKTEYGLLVTIDSGSGYSGEYYNVFTARIVQITSQSRREIRTLDTWHDWYGLVLRGQQSATCPTIYSQAPYYADRDVTLEKARQYVQVLTRIDHYLEKERETRGSTQDFAEYVVRFALSLGIKTLVQQTPRDSSIDGFPNRFRTLGDGAYWLRWEAQEWAEKYGKVKTV